MYLTCPKCFCADDVTFRRLPDRMAEYTCIADHGEHTWLVSQAKAGWTSEAEEGVTDELLEPLLACVLAGEPFVEFGSASSSTACAWRGPISSWHTCGIAGT